MRELILYVNISRHPYGACEMRIYRAPFLVFHRGVNVLRRQLERLLDDGDRRVDVYGGVDLPA